MVLERVGAGVGGHAGAAVAARVRGDGAEAEGGEGEELRLPGLAVGGPAVDEDEEGPGGGAGGPVEGRFVAAVGEGVFGEVGGGHGGGVGGHGDRGLMDFFGALDGGEDFEWRGVDGLCGGKSSRVDHVN